ncbi:hypothetical protein EJB05_32229, partial [Eragrostis curvula]
MAAARGHLLLPPRSKYILTDKQYIRNNKHKYHFEVQVVQMSMDGSFFTERYSGLLDCKRAPFEQLYQPDHQRICCLLTSKESGERKELWTRQKL